MMKQLAVQLAATVISGDMARLVLVCDGQEMQTDSGQVEETVQMVWNHRHPSGHQV